MHRPFRRGHACHCRLAEEAVISLPYKVGRGVLLGMRRIHSGYLDPDSSDWLAPASFLLRKEPDEDEEEDDGTDKGKRMTMMTTRPTTATRGKGTLAHFGG